MKVNEFKFILTTSVEQLQYKSSSQLCRSIMGLLFLSIFLLFSSIVYSGTSQLWGVNGELWDPRGRLADYSYTGYHHGEQSLPTTVPEVANVLTYGAIPDDNNDDSAAIQAAVDAVSGGALYFPAGEYRLEQQIIINHSDIVLRGAANTVFRH